MRSIHHLARSVRFSWTFIRRRSPPSFSTVFFFFLYRILFLYNAHGYNRLQNMSCRPQHQLSRRRRLFERIIIIKSYRREIHGFLRQIFRISRKNSHPAIRRSSPSRCDDSAPPRSPAAPISPSKQVTAFVVERAGRSLPPLAPLGRRR